ncbi:Ribosome biogenesis protein Nop16-like protein [Elsinoe fawcettii]|nr:Ribosome biogenesis protein Nop16-like protein [Elsinoe fawcettii]
MGRERQKFKNRSSVSKVKHKPKSKKQLLQNPIIAANWNQKETLSQNYARLGLTSKLNHATGGTEKLGSGIADSSDEDDEEAQDGRSIRDVLNVNKRLPTRIDIKEARVERDPETGAIVSVVEERKANPLRDPLNELSDEEGEGWEGFVNEHGVVDGARQKQDGTTEVVRRLEEEAARPVVKRERRQSEREKEWVMRLVEKYGDDYGKMARDGRLNPMQQSVGDIRKRVVKWKKSQGQA